MVGYVIIPWRVFNFIYHKHQSNVGKNPSLMDSMGYDMSRIFMDVFMWTKKKHSIYNQ